VTGELTTARINNHGFRGADFALEKPPGVIRVLTLGASSTFGYGNRDHETYPFQLEEILNARAAPGIRYEVINFAIPHATTDNIVSMFRAEGMALQPDFVTLYAGANDSSIKEEAGSVAGRLWLWLRERLLLFEFAHHHLEALLPPARHLWSVERLKDACDEIGARLVVATQQARSLAVEGESLRGLTYAGELALVRAQLSSGKVGGRFPLEAWYEMARRVAQIPTGHGRRARQLMADLDKTRIFLVHARLMEDLRAWAREHDVGFVDAIEALDGRRDQLISWVHLHPEANRRLARAFAEEILGRPLDETASAS
jgi:lysophospholipase L1-like esterase